MDYYDEVKKDGYYPKGKKKKRVTPSDLVARIMAVGIPKGILPKGSIPIQDKVSELGDNCIIFFTSPKMRVVKEGKPCKLIILEKSGK